MDALLNERAAVAGPWLGKPVLTKAHAMAAMAPVLGLVQSIRIEAEDYLSADPERNHLRDTLVHCLDKLACRAVEENARALGHVWDSKLLEPFVVDVMTEYWANGYHPSEVEVSEAVPFDFTDMSEPESGERLLVAVLPIMGGEEVCLPAFFSATVSDIFDLWAVTGAFTPWQNGEGYAVYWTRLCWVNNSPPMCPSWTRASEVSWDNFRFRIERDIGDEAPAQSAQLNDMVVSLREQVRPISFDEILETEKVIRLSVARPDAVDPAGFDIDPPAAA